MYPYHVIEYTTAGPSGVYFERLQDAIKMIMRDTYWYFAKIEDIRTGEILFKEERPYCILKGGMGKDSWTGEMIKHPVCFRTKSEAEAHAANIAASRLKYELEIIELRDRMDYLDI